MLMSGSCLVGWRVGPAAPGYPAADIKTTIGYPTRWILTDIRQLILPNPMKRTVFVTTPRS